MKKIKVSIELPIEKTRTSIVCFSAKTVAMVLGSASATGNYHMYKIKKLTNPMRWEIPMSEVKKHIIQKEIRVTSSPP